MSLTSQLLLNLEIRDKGTHGITGCAVRYTKVPHDALFPVQFLVLDTFMLLKLVWGLSSV